MRIFDDWKEYIFVMVKSVYLVSLSSGDEEISNRDEYTTTLGDGKWPYTRYYPLSISHNVSLLG